MPAYPASTNHLICESLVPLPAGSPASAVTASLLELFTSGSIAPGTRLPPERKLAEVLHVGRSAVREAFATLDTLGVIETHPGAGTYLRSTRSELLPQSLRWSALLGERSVAELVEVRSALEIHAARLVADRSGSATADALSAPLARMTANLDDLRAFVDADHDFHHELALASGNAMLVDLLQVTHSLLRSLVGTTPDDAVHARIALDEHVRVHSAIAASDPDAAALAMTAHMITSGLLLTEVT